MDPLTILGLVPDIVQLVDAAANAYGVCREICQHGATIEDARMSYTVTQLQDSYSVLKSSLSGSSGIYPHLHGSRVSLGDLGRQCCETADQLQKELNPYADHLMVDSVKVYPLPLAKF